MVCCSASTWKSWILEDCSDAQRPSPAAPTPSLSRGILAIQCPLIRVSFLHFHCEVVIRHSSLLQSSSLLHVHLPNLLMYLYQLLKHHLSLNILYAFLDVPTMRIWSRNLVKHSKPSSPIARMFQRATFFQHGTLNH